MGQPIDTALPAKAPCPGIAPSSHGAPTNVVMCGRCVKDDAHQYVRVTDFLQSCTRMHVAASVKCPLSLCLHLYADWHSRCYAIVLEVFSVSTSFPLVTAAVRRVHNYDAHDHSHLVLHTAILCLLHRREYPAALRPQKPASWISPPPSFTFALSKPSYVPFFPQRF